MRGCSMSKNSRIHFIPAIPKREKRVAVYARVSTNDAEQLKSLAVQVSAFTRLVASTPQWLLVDVYMDTKLVQQEKNSLVCLKTARLIK